MRDTDKVKKAQEFFADVTHPEAFVLAMRRYMHAVILLQNMMQIDWTDDDIPVYLQQGYHSLHDFCEKIDPVLKEPCL